MISQNKIKINFNNYEKILSFIPSSFADLKELFHELFEEANTNINYKFKYNLNNKDKYISEKDFQKAMDDLNKMNNPIIYVVKDKDEDFNLFEKLKIIIMILIFLIIKVLLFQNILIIVIIVKKKKTVLMIVLI